MPSDARLFEPLQLTPAYKTIFEAIERQILAGRIALGEQLPSETELARAFGVTRNTLREGIRLLEQSGYVRRNSGRRLTVCIPDYMMHAPSTSRALAMNSVTFRELWEVAMILEPGSARNAGERMTQEVLQILADNVRDTERAVASGYDIVTLDVDFHDIIADSADNKALELARKPISLLFYPSLRKLFAHPSAVAAPGRLVDAHKMILEALRDRDAERAESAMRRHLADFRRGYAHCGIDMNQSLIGAQDHAGP